MRVQFGLSIQNGILPLQKRTSLGVHTLGPQQFLKILEEHLGLSVPAEDIEYLRIEQYRQALKHYLKQEGAAFFENSFEADDLGTAAELLSRRDELLIANWDFQPEDELPNRLKVLSVIESYWASGQNTLKLYAGKADRLLKMSKEIARAAQFINQIQLCDEWEHFPIIWQKMLEQLENEGVTIVRYKTPSVFKNTDLGQWQAYLSGQLEGQLKLKKDGSLRIIRAYRETHLAACLAKLIQKNKTFQPAILMPQAKRTLENSFMMEGLPSLGVASASLARPSLQVLKLAPVFLWNPIDLNKIMEFVSLAVKPLEDGLAHRIATFLADIPGLYSDRWFAMINDYFKNELPGKIKRRPQLDAEKIEQQYEFWFKRKRVDSRSEKVSKSDVRAVYQHLYDWSIDISKQDETVHSVRVLTSQAGKLIELLDTLPEQELSYLELERIVRTIYEPAPIKYREAEAHKLDTVHQAGAITAAIPSLVWWDFFENEKDYFFSRWYPLELAYLLNKDIQIIGPSQQNEHLLSQRKKPVLWIQNQLILCIPDFCDGVAVQAHSLLGDLEAAFGEEGLRAITYYVDRQEKQDLWTQSWNLPVFQKEQSLPLQLPQPFLQLEKTTISIRDTETPTSLEQLLFYPYQWFFKHQIKLRKSSLLSVIDDARLFGNLSHRLIEKLLEQDLKKWTRGNTEKWVLEEIPVLLKKEGASLLMYGREPERIAFMKQMKFAAWSLICLLRDNEWSVVATEYELEGGWQNIKLKGRADLVLKKGKEQAIVDLKWRGATRYSNIMRNNEDIQLAIYAQLLSANNTWPHTAYFIIDKAKMITRNRHAFASAHAAQQEADRETIYQGMMKEIVATFDWRKDQLRVGQIEIRCTHTYADLEDIYGEQLLDLLEMKSSNAPFDDFDVLIGLVN